MGSDAEHHCNKTVGDQPEVPLPPLFPLLSCHLWRLGVSELLPVVNIVLRTDAKNKKSYYE